MADTIEVLVEGGKATPGPPLGPALGPMGVNVVQVVAKINEKTKSFEGMKVPVKVIIDPKTKSFDVKVGTPPTSQLLFKEMGAEKGSGAPNKDKAGNITIEQAIKVANMKGDSLMGKDLKMRVLEVVGVCVSSGINVEGKDAKAMQKEIKEGKWDAKLKA
ncbi:MAG: 50S ribosomal protein L11 [Methanomassiliicoccales archaeon]|jgi:large subunit ribosomal protein L11|nr:50S ribosomal protein L11 [Methanomassiliicoccales archaeon]